MSYILDALRRAEAERGRGTVPGIHTPVAPAPGASPAAGRWAVSPVRAAVVLIAVAALATAGTWWALQRPAPGGAVVAAAPVPAPAIPAAGVMPAPVAVAASPTPVVPGAPVAQGAPAAPAATQAFAPTTALPLATPRATAPLRPPAAPPTAARVAPDAARGASPGVAPPRPSEPARGPAPLAAAATGTVFAQADLPEAVRAQLPALKLSGVTYSSNPAYRMAIVNGQVLQEGDPAGPGLLLESIEPQRTVWSFQGYRYALPSQ